MNDLPRLYASEREVAAMLGRGLDWLKQNAEKLEQTTQFPKKDIATGLRHIPSIVEWAAKRNTRSSIESSSMNRGNKSAF